MGTAAEPSFTLKPPGSTAVGGATGSALAGLGINIGQLPTNKTLGLDRVYMGTSKVAARGSGYGLKPPEMVDEDKYVSLTDARNLPFSWSEEEKDKIIREGILRKVPGFSENMGMEELMSAWDDLVKLSTAADKSGYKVSPDDILKSYKSREGTTYKKGNWEYDAITDQPVRYVGPLTKTDTNTRVDLSTREDALSLAKTSMAQMLGRAPTQGELANYLTLLNGYERANPATSVSTSHIDPTTGEVTSTDTSSTGGAGAAGKQALLEEKMQQNPEYGAYQAATTYYGAMMQEIMRGY